MPQKGKFTMDKNVTEARHTIFSRRNVIIGSLIAAGGFVLSKKPRDQSGSEDAYFIALAGALKRAGIGKPTLIIDRARLAKNIDIVTSHIPAGMALRIAQKSVPSIGLMTEILERAGTNKLMVFNKEYLQSMCLQDEYRHILLGKPLPLAAVKNFHKFLDTSEPNTETLTDIEWLIDTPQRLEDYVSFARSKNIIMKVNIELDVGMHRGGISDIDMLKQVLTRLRDDDSLEFAGFMGYEKHIVYALGGKSAQTKAKDACWADYHRAVETARDVFGDTFAAEELTFNGGGSATYQLYKDTDTINDICLGSAFTKPSHFDFDTLSDHLPAAFIASPVIKQSEGLNLPGGGVLNSLIQMWDPNKRQTVFYYGGRWMADPVYPVGLGYNELYGRSSNQEMLNGSDNIEIQPDDFVFFRPQESEAVFLQFGDIAVYEDGEISEFWPVLPAAP